MSQLSLIERRWQAVFAALAMKRDDLAVTVEPTHDRRVCIEVAPRSWTEPEAWNALKDGPHESQFYLHCPASEWREMLADAVKGAAC